MTARPWFISRQLDPGLFEPCLFEVGHLRQPQKSLAVNLAIYLSVCSSTRMVSPNVVSPACTHPTTPLGPTCNVINKRPRRKLTLNFFLYINKPFPSSCIGLPQHSEAPSGRCFTSTYWQKSPWGQSVSYWDCVAAGRGAQTSVARPSPSPWPKTRTRRGWSAIRSRSKGTALSYTLDAFSYCSGASLRDHAHITQSTKEDSVSLQGIEYFDCLIIAVVSIRSQWAIYLNKKYIPFC